MVTTSTIQLTKRYEPPSKKASDWPIQFLSYLLTWLSKENHDTGAVFAEFDGRPQIEVGVSLQLETFLTKSGRHTIVNTLKLVDLIRFVNYLAEEILHLEVGTMGCGFLLVKFDDDTRERAFTLYFRRSAKLGVFFQIDQFASHL